MTKRDIENRLNELEDGDGTEQLRVVCTPDTRVNEDRVDTDADGITVEIQDEDV
jgi:hypothetical protein